LGRKKIDDKATEHIVLRKTNKEWIEKLTLRIKAKTADGTVTYLKNFYENIISKMKGGTVGKRG